MPSQDLKFRLLGEDAGASRALSKVQKEATGAHDAFSKLGGQLSQMGGPFAVVQDAFDGLAGGLEHVKEHGKSVGAMLAGVGIAATGAGVLLTQFGAKDQQAQAQLRQSVLVTGNSWGDFKGRIEDAIKSQERFGHTADDTQNALTALTTALQDPNKALQEMGLVADIAARKHISLAEASDTLIKAQEGNAKAFRSFGIVLDGNGTKADQINRALQELAKRMSGQASAAADTFSGRLAAAKTRAEDYLSSLAKFAPALLAIGPAATGVGAAIEFLNKKKAEGLVVAAAQEAAAQTELSNSAALVAASSDETTATSALVTAKQTEVVATSEVVTGETAEVTANSKLIASNDATTVSERAKGIAAAGTGKLVKAGALALGGFALGQVAGGIVGGPAGGALSNIGSGAGAGAALGSFFGPEGTLIGGIGGATLGGLASLIQSTDQRANLSKLAASGPVGLQLVKDREAAAQQQLAQAQATRELLNRQQTVARFGNTLAGPSSDTSTRDMQAASAKVAELRSKVALYNGVLHDQVGADKEATAAAAALNAAQAKLVPILDRDVVALHHYTDAALGTSSSADAFQKSINDLTAATVKNKAGNDVAIKTLTGTSDAAITNRDSLRQLAQQELAHVDALKQAGANSITVRNQTLAMSTAFEKQAVKVFGSKTAVDKLLGSLHLLPSQVKTEILIDPKDRVKARVAQLKREIDTLGADRTTNLILTATGHGGARVGLASGGLVSGGTPGRDSVPAMLMPGEFVVDAAGKNLHVSGGGGQTVINIHTGPMTTEGARELDRVLRRLNRESNGALGYAG